MVVALADLCWDMSVFPDELCFRPNESATSCSSGTDYVFPDEQLVADSFGLKHNGDLCWDECNNQDGLCAFCGTGRCCQEGVASSTGRVCYARRGSAFGG